MKVLVSALLILAPLVAFAEECRPAVEVAESLNVNASTDCNYKESGLNGVVHRLFNKGQSSSSSAVNPAATSVKSDPLVAEKISVGVEGPKQLMNARYSLLSAISQECLQGFRVMDELYIPEQNKLRIKLVYECL